MVPNTYTLNAVADLGRFAGEYFVEILLVALAFGFLGYGCRGLARFIRNHYAVPPNGLNRD